MTRQSPQSNDSSPASAAPLPSATEASASEKRECFLLNIDRISYVDASNLQRDFHHKCAHAEIPAILLLLEHDPVITMGVRTRAANILVDEYELAARGIKLVKTDRGGDVTYHGPGQLVGYPILDLRAYGGDLHGYLRSVEQSIIDTLAVFGLHGERCGQAGVWVGEKKVCSIGVAVRKMITYHGFALNVDPHMPHFRFINPCGLAPQQIGSMKELLGEAPDMDAVRETCARCFAEVFGLTLKPWPGSP